MEAWALPFLVYYCFKKLHIFCYFYLSFCNNRWIFCQFIFLYCRSKEHASHKSPHLPGAVVGGHCPRLNYHSSSSQIRGHPQNNRYGSQADGYLWLNIFLQKRKKICPLSRSLSTICFSCDRESLQIFLGRLNTNHTVYEFVNII